MLEEDPMDPIMIITDNLLDIQPSIPERHTVRAVLCEGKKILLMFSEADQMVGIPGGGLGFDESKLDGLYREMQEEIGARKVRIIEHLGYVEEFRISRSLNGQPIKVISDYYLVETEEFSANALARHEQEMGLKAVWMTFDEAIRINEAGIERSSDKRITFYHTQTEMLKYLKDRLCD
jgi:ADP-ribose pyrophosphatase YjhB (NUDIX family)